MKYSLRTKHGKIIFFFSILGFILLAPYATKGFTKTDRDFTSELIQLETRSGVTQKFAFYQPQDATASVIIFGGLFGNIGLKGSAKKPKVMTEKSFPVRNRYRFVKQGLAVAVVDAPSDQLKIKQKGDKTGMGLDFRLTDAHMEDIAAVISFLKKRNPHLPVFLLGHSLGTLSVVTAGKKLTNDIDGIIMSASATKPKDRWFERWPIYKNYPHAILDFEDLDKVTIPVLVAAHEKDSCVPTPPQNAKKLQELFTNSSDSQLLIFSGGSEASNRKGCNYKGHHSYNGIQEQVVEAMANWIRKHSSSS